MSSRPDPGRPGIDQPAEDDPAGASMTWGRPPPFLPLAA
ncbi:hypothetical protein C882_1564 [Caenispirillum salinarum AK4]|uniref:Uncharacterized protein n=1 Tax=Caenispirillum salinarum AK4 TaxID=1238182 RepID=K9H596_9PROT|nr:hypothetical protein C882_1564 [Caenispirillum salinarum AK4]